VVSLDDRHGLFAYGDSEISDSVHRDNRRQRLPANVARDL